MTLLVVSLVLAVGLFACSKSENTSNSNSNSTTTSEKSTTTTTTTTTASTSGEKIGVPECDDFIAKYESCTSKVPEMAREQYKNALAQWKTSWKQLAANPQTKGTLAAACKQAAEQQAAAWKMYGCAN
jgi:hypothetical protein